MATPILTPDNAALYLQLQIAHRQTEKRFHTLRDLWKDALEPTRSWSKAGYAAILKDHVRNIPQMKILAVEHPDIYESILKPTRIYQVIITGPPDLEL